MAGVLVLPGNKTLFVVHHRDSSEEISEPLLLGIDGAGLAQLRLRVHGGFLYAQLLHLLVADTGHLASGDQQLAIAIPVVAMLGLHGRISDTQVLGLYCPVYSVCRTLCVSYTDNQRWPHSAFRVVVLETLYIARFR